MIHYDSIIKKTYKNIFQAGREFIKLLSIEMTRRINLIKFSDFTNN